MKKRNSVIVLLILFVFTASYFYFINSNEALSANKMLNMEEMQMVQRVVEVEKNLARLQLNQITLEDSKKEIALFFHSYYRDTFLQELTDMYKAHKAVDRSTQLPLFEKISKVYTSRDETIKYIYVKSQEKSAVDQTVKLYTFKKEDGDWEIISLKNYTVSDKKTSGFDDSTIEYESMKIMD